MEKNTQLVLELLKAMAPEELAALKTGMKANDITLPAASKEKTFVAIRRQLVDSKPGARVTRKAGELYPLTEKALMNTLTTWVKKDADVRIPVIIKSINGGGKESFTNFELIKFDASLIKA